ncbi:MAG: hypothetical protein LBS93_08005 [Synergistaceae bacterium]|jgi:hypothetical protein|nr:hypothetical protein [Synergistaceae bacterium]
MAYIGGLQGGTINPNAGNVIRPPSGEGQPLSRPSVQQPLIQNGAVVEGLVIGKDGEAYQVRIGANILNARSTVALFVGQRFRAVWDSSTTPPMMRLQQADLAVLSRFAGRDQQIALALLTRGLPVKDEVIWTLRQQWMQGGGSDQGKLGVLAELWARGAPMTEGNVALLAWYMELSPDVAMRIWKKIRERLRARKFSSPREFLDAIKDDGDEDVRNFLKAHVLAGKPARGGLDPAMLLAPAWWPVDDGESEPMMAKVSFSSDERADRQIWWVSFEIEGNSIGAVMGNVVTNSKAISVNIRLENEAKVPIVRENLPSLRDDLSELPLTLQHLGVGALDREERYGSSKHGLDMEA